MLEVMFYRHTTEEPLTKEFILNQMIYPRDLLSYVLIYNYSINNHFNLVCKKNEDKNCIYTTEFGTAPVILFHKSLIGKANGFFLKSLLCNKFINCIRLFALLKTK